MEELAKKLGIPDGAVAGAGAAAAGGATIVASGSETAALFAGSGVGGANENVGGA
jgi:hypothetical protein